MVLQRDVQRKKTAGWVFNSNRPARLERLGTIIARSGANTGIAARGVCVSACVMLWANGALKSAAPDTQIGVHNASIELADGSCTDAYSYGATGRSIHAVQNIPRSPREK